MIEPYRQQFEGSATGHYAIRGFTDLSNDKYGVTVSPIEGSLVCYGEPTSSPICARQRVQLQARPHLSREQPAVPVSAEQHVRREHRRRPARPGRFHWSLRSHAGDWKTGGAEQFGRSVQQPLLAWRADGKNAGALPASASFMSVDAPNVMCSVIKPAEMNGRGFIIRLNETTGKETTATVSLPLLPAIESVRRNFAGRKRPAGNTGQTATLSKSRCRNLA